VYILFVHAYARPGGVLKTKRRKTLRLILLTRRRSSSALSVRTVATVFGHADFRTAAPDNFDFAFQTTFRFTIGRPLYRDIVFVLGRGELKRFTTPHPPTCLFVIAVANHFVTIRRDYSGIINGRHSERFSNRQYLT